MKYDLVGKEVSIREFVKVGKRDTTYSRDLHFVIESSHHTTMWYDICGGCDAVPDRIGVVRLIVLQVLIYNEKTLVTFTT